MSFVPVRVGTLRGDQKINFDVYLPLNNKHILYIRRGDSFEGTRLAKLKEKRLKKLFIKPEDEESYRKYMQSNIDAAYDSKSKQTIENRTQVVQGLQESAAEAVYEDPASKESYESAKQGSQKFVEFLMQEQQSLKAMLAIENTDQSLTHHGVAVATLSVAIAKKINFADAKNLHLLSLGALIHDVGHMRIESPYSKKITEMSADESKLYQTHVLEGANLVKDLAHLDQQVVQIIAEHHELADGSGYPFKRMQKDISPMAMIVSTANGFDRMISFEKVPREDAIKKFTVDMIGKYPLEYISALKAIALENK